MLVLLTNVHPHLPYNAKLHHAISGEIKLMIGHKNYISGILMQSFIYIYYFRLNRIDYFKLNRRHSIALYLAFFLVFRNFFVREILS